MNLALYLVYYFLITTSVVGYGFAFAKIVNNNLLKFNIGYIGFFGIFTLITLSYFTNLFFAHSMSHNLIVLIIGILFFLYFVFYNKNYLKKNVYILFGVSLILILGLFISKSHDDFPYYHLPYALHLVEHKLQIGMGYFNLGYRTTSSIFYLNSLFYLPLIKFYHFHAAAFMILVFANIIFIKKILNKKDLRSFDFIYILNLFAFVFINVVFYRLAEHGTDRSGQIIVFLVIISVIELLKNRDAMHESLQKILILIAILVTLKSFFVLYVALVLYLYFKFRDKIDLEILLIKSKLGFFILFIALLFLNSNLMNSGCLVFPVDFTCFPKLTWAIPINEVQELSRWYEQWAKAGAGPNFRVENPELYIQGFNWVPFWFQEYFFNKVSDTLAGIIFIIFIFYCLFFRTIKSKSKKQKYEIIYLFIIGFFLIWFYKYPALRYGGFCLLALVLFFPASLHLEGRIKNNKQKTKFVYLLIFLTFAVYNYRNIERIGKEIKVYNYKPFSHTFFFVYKTKYKEFFAGEGIYVNKTIDHMCWSVPSPCTAGTIPKVKKKFGYIMFYDEREK